MTVKDPVRGSVVVPSGSMPVAFAVTITVPGVPRPVIITVAGLVGSGATVASDGLLEVNEIDDKVAVDGLPSALTGETVDRLVSVGSMVTIIKSPVN